MTVPLPTSPLGAYIAALSHSMPERLQTALALVADPAPLVADFDSTVRAFWQYDNLNPFTPGRTATYSPGCEKTEEVATALEQLGHCHVTSAPELDFSYVDREIVPAAGHVKSGVIKVDVILATKLKNRPIIGEIK